MRRSILLSLLLVIAAVTATAAGNFSYMFSRDGGNTIISGNIDISRLHDLKARLPNGDALWARIGAQQYLIRDAATLAEARAAFRHADALHAEYERLQERMRPLEKKESRLERRMDDLSDELSDNEDLTSAERRRMQAELETLTEQIRPVSKQLRELEKEEERLDHREEALVEVAEADLKRIIERAISRGVATRIR